MRAEMAQLREEVAALAAALKTSSAGQAEGTGSAESGGEWAEFLHSLGMAREQAAETMKDVAEEVRKHPIMSIAVAFGIGYVAARILRWGGR
jgi:hypothetical protein